ncbi:SubName: Full=Uncharacterized protein {ECO:0000313/EMBL:CCA68126.1} [Serendipita indica DSM 11827]|nr:SubName: Full=Uncharacterized protein {ECO:0000313/EMBL:CCA68126.1} [Serendipita indica DSM 11827]
MDPGIQMHHVESGGDPLAQWNISVNAIDVLIRKLVQENAELKAKIEDQEFQNYTLTTALSTTRSSFREKESLAKSLEVKLEEIQREVTISNARSQAERNLVMTLIDGDGYIFDRELLTRGEDGGRDAAKILSNGVMKHLSKEANRPASPDLWTMIFLSKDKLEAVLSRSSTCTAEQFRLFIKGFSQAQSLFSFVEVGPSKEAADHKIKEHLSKFIGNPKIFRVILGVDHDNGYSSAISSAMTNDPDQRLVLLQAHPDIARDIAALNLPMFSIDTLFKVDKLTTQAPSPPTSVPTQVAIVAGSYAAVAGPPKSPPASVAVTIKKITYSPEKNTIGWTKGAIKRE